MEDHWEDLTDGERGYLRDSAEVLAAQEQRYRECEETGRVTDDE